MGLAVAAALAWIAPQQANARPNRAEQQIAQQMLSHINVLASDDFAGREPGTDGEGKTLRYIGQQLFQMGMVSGTNDPGHPWFAPVTLVAREPAASVAQFARRGRPVAVGDDDVLMLTSGRRSLVQKAPLYFVGRGGSVPPRAELAGRVAVMLDADTPAARAAAATGDVPRDRQSSTRQNALLAGGALAVITVLDGDRTLASVAGRRKRSGYALASQALGGDLEGFITRVGMARLLAGGPVSLDQLEAEADRPDFVPRVLDLSASLEATTRETTIRTHNLIGKIPGRHPEAGAVLLLAHWDHFGICGAPPAEHLVCNGAVDNASGVAAMLEIARRLARPAVPYDRDIYILATTAEELGLLGAEAFAEKPPIPLSNIVAALNVDSVAIAPADTPLGIVGKGMTPLDAAIAAVARQQKRKLSESTAPNQYIRRQDGWALINHDVPAVMVTSAYGNIALLETFFDTDYHRPQDVVKPGIELGGAAQDVLFHVALIQYFADMRRYVRPGG
ncbi:M20/M25/M40 family metallo-hydrolase [Novosphingobium ovatum]|uniref:M20/M25/M40 family metallo-hydrolase n=1 Tax=Novosphingobium ovatum TaxID=1908523 RepID=UPI0029FED3C5|nr:M20/M25/M40 family metallo-hydrolase [Novosphingobium ovatum]